MTIVCGFGCTFVGSVSCSADGAINYDVSEIIFNIIDDAHFMTRNVGGGRDEDDRVTGCMTQQPIHHIHVPLQYNPQAFKLMIKCSISSENDEDL